jgi:heme o synthase
MWSISRLLVSAKLARYLELTKPKVTALNVAVGITCFVLAELPRLDWLGLIMFSVVAYLAVGGCGVLNAFYDRNLDKLMMRTCRRAIPSGAIVPSHALLFGVVMLSASLFLTYLLFGTLTLLSVSIGAFIYLCIYTFWLKRRSHWNVLIGGLSGGFAAISGWASTGNMVGLAPILAGLLDFLWTPGHFWALSIARSQEYEKARVPMLPVTVGLETASEYVFLFNVLTLVSSFLFPIFGLAGPLYLVITGIAGAALMWRSWKLLESPGQGQGLRLFKLSIVYLACILAALVVDRMFVPPVLDIR